MIRRPNFKLNWKYALGELCLIFLGISLAIAFQNWNESRKDAAFEREILKEVQGSLALDNKELYQIEIANISAEKAIDKVLTYAEKGGSKAQRDSIPYWLGQFFNFERFNPSSGAYEVLKSEGLQKITNRGLRLLIAEYYDEALPNVIQSLRDVEEDFKTNLIQLAKDQFKDFKFKEIAEPVDIDAFISNRKNIVYIKMFRDNRAGSADDLRAGIDLNQHIWNMLSDEMN